jgi:hypothetical protein
MCFNRVLVSRTSAKPDTNKKTNKLYGWRRLLPDNRDQTLLYRFVFSDVADDREHLRTGSGAQGRNHIEVENARFSGISDKLTDFYPPHLPTVTPCAAVLHGGHDDPSA